MGDYDEYVGLCLDISLDHSYRITNTTIHDYNITQILLDACEHISGCCLLRDIKLCTRKFIGNILDV